MGRSNIGHGQGAVKGRRRYPVSLRAFLALFVLGVVVTACLLAAGLEVRPARFPGIGIGTTVSPGRSLGLNLVIQEPPSWGSWSLLLIPGFWLHAVLMGVLLLTAPIEWALSRAESKL